MSAGGRPNGDEAILLALACGATYANAAQQAGVHERTVRRRMANPAFVARLRHLRGEMLERAGGALVAAAMKSVQTLLSLQDMNQPPAVRLGAARAVLEIGLKIREVAELEVRLRELEERIEGTTPGNQTGNQRGARR